MYRDLPRGNASVADDIWDKRLFIRPVPGQPAVRHTRKSESPWGRYTIHFRDWLRDHPAERIRYQQMKTELALAHADDADFDDYTRAKTAYFDTVQTPFEQYGAPGTADDLVALIDELGSRQVDLLGFLRRLDRPALGGHLPERISRSIIASSRVLPVDARAFGDLTERKKLLSAEAKVWADPSLSGPALTRAAAIAGAPANVWRDAVLSDYLDQLAEVQFSAEWIRLRRTGTLPSPRVDDPIGQLGRQRRGSKALPEEPTHGQRPWP